MEVSAEYTLTDIGILPMDWKVQPIGSFTICVAGGTPSTLVRDYWGGNIPWMSSGELNNKYITEVTGRITKLGLNNSSAQEVPPYSVLIGLAGQGKTRGTAAITMIPLCTNQSIAAILPNESFNPQYLYFHLDSIYRKLRTMSSGGGGRGGLNLTIIKRLLVPLPPLAEQQAIATALTDVDSLITSLDKLIGKKKDIKQATMQELLTGRTRLPGFDGEWDEKTLESLGRFLKGSGIKKDEANSGQLPCIRYGEIYTDHHNIIRGFTSWISRDIAETAQRLYPGDLLFAGSGETKEDIGKCVALTEDIEAYAGGDVVILRTNNVDPTFMGYLCNTKAVNNQKASLGQGDAVVHISAKALSGIILQMPKKPEQQAIATILSDMDKEIEALEERREKTLLLKQGMMQELLTGKTRLVKPATKDSQQSQPNTANIHFQRSVLAAEIVSRLHEEPTFGHVKFEKMIFLVEHLCDIDTGSNYQRKAAGPYDNRALRSIDSQLKKQKWFEARRVHGRYKYVPLEKANEHSKYFTRYFSDKRDSFANIIDTFRTADTERCEIVATLYSAWNDLLQQQTEITDERIIHEVLNNWHESKKRIPEERWQKALAWMRDKGFVPTL